MYISAIGYVPKIVVPQKRNSEKQSQPILKSADKLSFKCNIEKALDCSEGLFGKLKWLVTDFRTKTILSTEEQECSSKMAIRFLAQEYNPNDERLPQMLSSQKPSAFENALKLYSKLNDIVKEFSPNSEILSKEELEISQKNAVWRLETEYNPDDLVKQIPDPPKPKVEEVISDPPKPKVEEAIPDPPTPKVEEPSEPKEEVFFEDATVMTDEEWLEDQIWLRS